MIHCRIRADILGRASRPVLKKFVCNTGEILITNGAER